MVLLADEALEFEEARVVLGLEGGPRRAIDGYEAHDAVLSELEAVHRLAFAADVRRVQDNKVRSAELALEHALDAVDESDQRFVVGRDFLVPERHAHFFERTLGHENRCIPGNLGLAGIHPRDNKRNLGRRRGVAQVVLDDLEHAVGP